MDIEQHIKIAVDGIVFGYAENKLQVLLVKQKFGIYKDNWVLVGGFVKNGETLRQAIERELKEEAGIQVSYLEQLYTFGDDINRDPRMQVISVAYFSLVNNTQFDLVANTDAKDAQWFPIDEIPELGFDHNAIIEVALNRLKNKLKYQPIGFDLLSETFIFSDLENLYCTILEREIDRRNFRKKILSFELVVETGEMAKRNFGRPAKLFKFNKMKYNELSENGFMFEINFA